MTATFHRNIRPITQFKHFHYALRHYHLTKKKHPCYYIILFTNQFHLFSVCLKKVFIRYLLIPQLNLISHEKKKTKSYLFRGGHKTLNSSRSFQLFSISLRMLPPIRGATNALTTSTRPSHFLQKNKST
jgi:hypothetical protein